MSDATAGLHRDAAAFVRDVPPLPQLVVELLSILGRESLALSDVTAKLSRDQALVASTLRLANSSFYGMRGKVVNVREALMVLGLQQIRSMITAAAIANQLPCRDAGGAERVRVAWRHAYSVAMVARQLAQRHALEPETAFTAALVHDLGRLVLIVHHREDYEAILAGAAKGQAHRLEIERMSLGHDHAAIGYQLCRKWNFADVIANAVRDHHQPPGAPRTTFADVVHVADAIVHAADLEDATTECVPPVDEGAWSRTGLGDDDLATLLRCAESAWRESGMLTG